ncbi:Xaa-Pro aminopeptidase [Caenispirillum salinarum AK4]|uniref:Xaa-Pro aminopeptidase n=1 Tax=Caenispirillum salinarum AK4 TaxID=1238182 RepID=K9H2E0_9PROT|nr:aminopeptidase P family protein [Caenispirillum salinarum]EKV31732.1 Xaa-Pro aminopeptidase [Caenispirillum salinarum AK4]
MTAPAPDPADRLRLLRGELTRLGLDGFIVPRADEHQGEYVPPRAERLAWLTGFTGSAGVAVVLADKAALFVDGRYTLQAAQEVDTEAFEILHVTETPPHEWLADQVRPGARIGFDAWLHTPDGVARVGKALEAVDARLLAVADGSNPVDAVWSDQPDVPLAPVVPHAPEVSGKPAAEKLDEVAATLRRQRADAAVITTPDSLAWLLNIRGGDVPYAPFPLGFAIVHAGAAGGAAPSVDLFMDERKLSDATRAHLGEAVTVMPPADLPRMLDRLGGDGARVVLDHAVAPAAVRERLAAAGAKVLRDDDPCALPKACKNPVELEGARAAHRRDGAALARFLCWFSEEAPGGRLDELTVSDKLEEYRKSGDRFRGLSFPTIAGAGPNGAIVHYRVTPETTRTIEPGGLFLLDSGAQYLDGTTDVTRTLSVGAAGPEERKRFTQVLKGHIALASAVFPEGTTGSQLDVLARHALWQDGVDYDHGTGHGVGSYLSVHEGPQRISKMGNRIALRPGMILSNEPGYYKTGAYGIRIENLVAVREAQVEGAERAMLGFETLTLAPIDRMLIEPALLTPEEVAWVDAYHQRVHDEIAPQLADSPAVQRWLVEATRPLAVMG